MLFGSHQCQVQTLFLLDNAMYGGKVPKKDRSELISYWSKLLSLNISEKTYKYYTSLLLVEIVVPVLKLRIYYISGKVIAVTQ